MFIKWRALIFVFLALLALTGSCGRPEPIPSTTPTPAFQALDEGLMLPPQVIATDPSGGQEMPLDGSIALIFDQAMDKEVTAEAWSLRDPAGEPVAGEIAWMDDMTMRFTPSQPLQPGASYAAALTTVAASLEGAPLSEELSFVVNTLGELQIGQVFPADGATEVENAAIVTVVFNRPVAPLVMAEEQEELPAPLQITPAVFGKGEWLNTSVYVFTPGEPLRSATRYTVTVPAGLTDVSGAELEADYRWSFSTAAPAIGELILVDLTTNPEDWYSDVPPDQTFAIRFRQPMDQISTQAAFSLIGETGEAISVELAWDEDSAEMSIAPREQLALGSSYTLTLTESAQDVWGGSLLEGLEWHFSTYPYPAISNTSPANGEIQDYFSGEVTIYFVSPMNIDSIKERITISPRPEGEIEWYYNPWEQSISYYGLKASTRYTLTFAPGMSDIYGNLITQGGSVRFTTGSYSPYAYLEMPYGPAIYRADGPQEFYTRYVNVEAIDFALYELSGYQFYSLAADKVSQWDYTPPQNSLVREWRHVNTRPLDQRALEGFALQTDEGDSLAPGFYFLTLGIGAGEEYNRDQRLLVVADSNLTMKTTRSEALLWLTQLSSGAPLRGVPLTVYDENFQSIGQGVTDEDGLLQLDLPVSKDDYAAWYALADDGEHLAFASADWSSGVSPYDFGIWSDYYTPPNQPTVYVYSDRPLYRPGHPVSFKGIVRMNDDLSYSLPQQEEVEVVINSYQETVYEQTLPLTEFGSFAGELLLDDNAALGSYDIFVYLPENPDSIGYGYFSVAEYRKPEFQVGATAEPEAALPGEEFTFTVDAQFFAGGAVAGADVEWGLYATVYDFSPPGELSTYNFRDDQRDMEYSYFEEYYSSELIADGTARTDENGQVVVTLPAVLHSEDAEDEAGAGVSQQFTFEATVTDLAGTAVSDRALVVAHQSSVYAGIRPQKYIGDVGEEQTFELVAVDWDFDAVPGLPLDVQIVERRWHSVQAQNPDGSIEWETSVEEIPIAAFEEVETDEQGRASVNFTPPNGGVFKATVSAQDAFGNQSSASAYMWVSGDDYIAWRMTGDNRMDLILDRDRYAPGETAEVMITSPFQGENYALVTVERGHIRASEVILLTSNSTVYQLPILEDMAPNVYISVTVIQGAGEDGMPDFRMGMSEIKVDASAQTLNVEITPDKEKAGPGDQVTYTVRTTDMAGQPVSAEISLALTDLATLTLSGPNSIPILDYFYSPRSLSVRTAMPIVYNIEQYNAELEELRAEGQGGGSGGGKGEDVFGVAEIREDFPDTAYWNAHVITDENGEATVTITLPDNLTTWRMDGRAVTLDTRVGDTFGDLVSTKPLLVRPQTPRFFVVGDEARLGAAVHNNTEKDLVVDVSLVAEGINLMTDETQQVEIAAGKQVYLFWMVAVQPGVERVDLVISAEGGGYSDASRPTLTTLEGGGIPVYRYVAPETVGAAGMLEEEGAITEAIILPAEDQPPSGELVVQVEPSLVAGMATGLDYLEHYPYECVEQTISRFLPNMLTVRALQASGRADADLQANLDEEVNTALQRLYSWQNPDGGWGWWTGQESDDLTTAYVVLGLAEAKNAGYPVSSYVIDQATWYLRGHLVRLRSLDAQHILNRQAFMLFVLARAGLPQVSRTVQLYDLRQSLSLYGRAYLAQTLYMIDSLDADQDRPDDPRLDTLISDFANAAILSASGAHWEEGWTDYWNWNTDTRTTAIVLGALIEVDPENALNANAVRWLMTHRSEGYWSTTQETAWALMGLTGWMLASGELEADFQYAVALNGQQEGGSVANSENLQETYELRFDIAELLSGQANRLTIARDDGPGNLYYTAHLTVDLPVEDIQALDRGMIISRSYFESSESNIPLAQIEQGEILLARITIVAPNALHYVVIEDPLPAGLEALDQALETNPQELAPDRYDWDDLQERGWGWWYFDHVELRDEKVVISADYLPPGTYIYTYLVRASTPGEFRVIPPTAQEFYFHEVYGRGEGSLFVVKP